MLIWYSVFSNYASCWIQVMAGGAGLLVWSGTATLLWWSRPGPQLWAGPWPGPQTRELQQHWRPLYKVWKMTRFCGAQLRRWPFIPVWDGYRLLAVSFPAFCKCFSQIFRVTCSAATEKEAYVYLSGWLLNLLLCIQYIVTWRLPCNFLCSFQLE